MRKSAMIDAHAHIFSSLNGLTGSGPVRGLDYAQAQVSDEPPFQLFPPYARDTSFPPEILLANMDWAGVDRAVLLQGSFYGARNDEVRAACEKYPDRFVGAAFLDPWTPDPKSEFDRLFSGNGFGILKIEFSHETGLHGLHPGSRLDDGQLDWLWKLLEERDIVLTVDLGRVGGPAYQTDAIRKIAANHSSLKVVICHLGWPIAEIDQSAELRALWEDQVTVGQLPNVWFDLSALPHRAEQSYPYPRMIDWIRYALEVVGHAKLMWGTDAPGVLSGGTYPQLLSAYTEQLVDLTAAEQDAIFGKTASLVYG